MKEFSTIWDALNFAFIKYGNIKRKSGDIPYVIHPIRVIMILRAAGFSEFEDKDLILAALFHDLLEDTNLLVEDLKQQFGNHVALIVKELTKPIGNDKDEWLRSFSSASKEAKLIKMADRIDNLMDMKSIGWTAERQKTYAKQGLIILEACGDVNSKLANKLKEVVDSTLVSL